jgi:hypothetical protein
VVNIGDNLLDNLAEAVDQRVIIDSSQMVVKLSVLHVSGIDLVLDSSLDILEEISLLLFDGEGLSISLVQEDVVDHLGVQLMDEFHAFNQVRDGLAKTLILDIDDVNHAATVLNLADLGGASILEVVLPWKVVNIHSQVGAKILGDLLNLVGGIQHHGVLWTHSLEDDLQDRGLSTLWQTEHANVHWGGEVLILRKSVFVLDMCINIQG